MKKKERRWEGAVAGEGRGGGGGGGGGRKNAHTMTFRHASIMTVRSAVFFVSVNSHIWIYAVLQILIFVYTEINKTF